MPGARRVRILGRVLARKLALLVLLLGAGPALGAGTPAGGGLPDVVGPRTLGLSAALGVAASNEGLYLNPAAVGVRKRYSLEAGALVDRRGSADAGQFFGGSVVDSMSSPITGGVAYLRAQEGAFVGSVWNVLLSGPLAKDVHLGVAGKYVSGDYEAGVPDTAARSVRFITLDAGLFWQVGDVVSIGAAGYNLLPAEEEAVAPMGAGAGIAVGSDRSFQVTADWRADFERAGETKNRYAAGVEVMLGKAVPVRAGFVRDEMLGGRWWSAGAGLVSQGGVALDVGYRQSIDDPDARTIAAALKLFLFR